LFDIAAKLTAHKKQMAMLRLQKNCSRRFAQNQLNKKKFLELRAVKLNKIVFYLKKSEKSKKYLRNKIRSDISSYGKYTKFNIFCRSKLVSLPKTFGVI
jgi:hypothetical protein